ncbi:MAG: hypothetical protein ACI9BD_001122, partial [Candidatus Marinamargulisbacteria bacterium]
MKKNSSGFRPQTGSSRGTWQILLPAGLLVCGVFGTYLFFFTAFPFVILRQQLLTCLSMIATGVGLSALLKGLRRYLFFGGRLGYSESVVFDQLFQGAVMVFPQLPYPASEKSILSHATPLAPEKISQWFLVRLSSVVLIPVFLILAA